jgi:ABC-type uncharacterized transport system auxiliary subunit
MKRSITRDAMRRAARRIAAVAAAGMLAGCISIGPGDPTPLTWYELATPLPAETSSRTDPRGLWIDVLPGSSFYEATSIAYSRAPAQRAYYQFASWTEPVAQRLARIVERDLRARRGFAEVGAIGGGSRAELYLRIVVNDFYHDAAVEPGIARVTFSAELLDLATRRNLGRRAFSHAAPVGEADAAGAVAAFDVAVAAALDELAGWLSETVAR